MKQLSRELMALWRENTEPDMRVNSVTGKEAALRQRQLYQDCFEGAWLLNQGLCAMGRDGSWR